MATANAVDAAAGSASLSARALDEAGPAPAFASQPTARALAPLRGREFVVVVETDGRVREVLPPPGSGMLLKQKAARAPEAAASAPLPSSPLLELRFAPGERPRRLLVRVE